MKQMILRRLSLGAFVKLFLLMAAAFGFVFGVFTLVCRGRRAPNR